LTPSGATALIPTPGQVAQLVEQGTENPRVGGSIPSLATITIPNKNNIYLLLAGIIPGAENSLRR
jgi:hypothetical protein